MRSIFSVTPVQAILAMAFQIWLIVFPIILIRKINYLAGLIENHCGTDERENAEG